MEVLDVPTVAKAATKGSRETFSRNLSKGTYRVQVPAQSGYKAGLSKAVTIKR